MSEQKSSYDYKLNGNKIDLVLKQQGVTPTSEFGKNDFKRLCPNLIWEVGKETEISTCQAVAVEKTRFDLVDVQGGKLYFGIYPSDFDPHPLYGRSEADRPIRLGDSSPLTKQ